MGPASAAERPLAEAYPPGEVDDLPLRVEAMKKEGLCFRNEIEKRPDRARRTPGPMTSAPLSKYAESKRPRARLNRRLAPGARVRRLRAAGTRKGKESS